MFSREQLRAAASAHHDWGDRVRTAIDSDESPLSPDLMGWHDQCELHELLRDPSTPALRSCECYRHCVEAHDQFHESAATLIDRVRAGLATFNQDAGENSEFSRSLATLVEAVTDWSQHAAIRKSAAK
jgi:hypothetical protein